MNRLVVISFGLLVSLQAGAADTKPATHADARHETDRRDVKVVVVVDLDGGGSGACSSGIVRREDESAPLKFAQ